MKRLICALLSVAIINIFAPIVFSASTDNEMNSEIVYYYSDCLPDEQDYYEHLSSKYDTQSSTYELTSNSTLPDVVDLSNSVFFPEIGYQGRMASCTAFSITYYQFTYEANKLNNIPSTSEENTYSPKWTYYATKTGNNSNSGSFDSDVYNFLRDHGALKWSDYPFSEDFDSSYPWPTDTSLMRNALKTRVSDYKTFQIPCTGTPIQSHNDSDLNFVKSELNSGNLLRVFTNYYFSSVTHNGKLINYRCSSSESRYHSMIIVGYDDTITYDINGDGEIGAGERGAFKLANSYGPTHGTEGYEWIMYDALNEVSSVSKELGDWETACPGTRAAAFSFTNSLNRPYNWFTKMIVENYDPLFISEVNLTLSDGLSYCPKLYKKSISSGESSCNTFFANFILNTDITRTELFDYNSLFVSLENDMSGYDWGVSIADSPSVTSVIVVNTAKFTDDRGNTISNYSQDSDNAHKYYCSVDLSKGDVNYDGVLNTSDVVAINQYVADYDNLSDVQLFLADYDNNGVVNLSDSSAILRAIS